MTVTTTGRTRVGARPAASPAARRRPRLPFSPWHLLLAPLAALFAVPLLWLLLSSFMSNAEINRFPPALWPSGVDLGGYRYVLGNAMFPRWLLNSAIVSAVAVASNLVFGTLGGYAFARMRFAGSRVLLVLMLATMVVPFQLTMIPTFLAFAVIGLMVLAILVSPIPSAPIVNRLHPPCRRNARRGRSGSPPSPHRRHRRSSSRWLT